jgi:hypothetical protein
MDLEESRFYYAGQDMNFTIFSDSPCRVKHLESIPLPMGQNPVDVYAIEPGANSQWVVVQQTEQGKSRLKFFVREGGTFHESHRHHLPQHLRKNILQRVRKLSGDSEPPLAA